MKDGDNKIYIQNMVGSVFGNTTVYNNFNKESNEAHTEETVCEDVEDVEEENVELSEILPKEDIDPKHVWRSGLIVDKVKEVLCGLNIKKLQWMVVYKVVHELGLLENDTQDNFVEWLNENLRVKITRDNLQSLKGELKAISTTSWNENTIPNNVHLSISYMNLASRIRESFIEKKKNSNTYIIRETLTDCYMEPKNLKDLK